ncbi:BMP family ABC transporter substrate-binding protein [Rothia sp. ZJ932]|nr:BMP family ABC transporter substrate-binding protein [Rothia sp. ZJ1223]QRZ62642.1 BMP family ABC transporter substrate-binding protein [Rothia sp. ZJ932]
MAGAGSLLGISALLLSACGAAPEESSTASGDNADYRGCMVSDFGGFDDKSFNENTYAGLTAAVEELGIEKGEAQSTSETEYGPNLNQMVQSGCNMTVTVGFGLADATKEVAEANPDLHFAIVDDGSIELDNVRPLVYDTAQAAFQAGYLAAAQSKTGKVATYGGLNFPTVTIFMDGFAQGVKYYNEQNDKNVEVLGWDTEAQNGTFTGDFTDQGKGKTNTQNFLSEGADVIMPVAGPVGGGTLEAVKEHNASNADSPASVIWVDSDGFETNPEYRDIILTSVQKLMKEAVLETFKQDVEGNFTSEAYVGTLENGGVALAPFHNFEDEVSAETKAALDDIKAKIISGDIKVETAGSPSA